jgi:hypothetical protein
MEIACAWQWNVYPPVEDLYTRPNLRTNQALELGFLRAARALLARGGLPAVPVRKKRIPGDEDEEDAGMGKEAGEDARAEHIMRRFLCNSPEDCTPGKRADGVFTTGAGEDHTWEFCLTDADNEAK